MAATRSLPDPSADWHQNAPGAGVAGPLETYANNFSPPEVPNALPRALSPAQTPGRDHRYRRRGVLWDVSSLERVRDCGRVPVTASGSVTVRLRNGVAGYAGLASCGSVWADPVCNAKVMARRAVEVGSAVSLWQAQGGAVAFGTFTMRHQSWQRLATLWAALAKAWHAVTGSAQWVKDQAAHDVEGWLRIVEVTRTVRNGWHVHVHVLLFLGGKQTPDRVRRLHLRMFGRWSRKLVRLGLGEPLLIAQDMHLVTNAGDDALARYFTKVTDNARRIGLEVTQAQTKQSRGRHGGRTPWAFLDDVEQLGTVDALEVWHEWEAASRNKKQMTWSGGLRRRIGLLAAEQSDEEIAATEHGSAADDLVLIDAAGWRALTADPVALAHLLTITERGGLSYLRAFLDLRGITYDVMGEAA